MWSLAGSVALMESAAVRVAVDLRAPCTTIPNANGSTSSTTEASVQLLRVIEPVLRLREVYVRGQDLIADYVATNDQELSFQIYWRILPTGGSRDSMKGGIEFVVSAQTSALDGLPALRVSSDFQVGQARTGDGWALLRGCGLRYAYLEMVHPSNHLRSRVERSDNDPGICLSHYLFPGQLEKGVIRRARLRSCFLEKTADETIASSCRVAFLDSPLPLTA